MFQVLEPNPIYISFLAKRINICEAIYISNEIWRIVIYTAHNYMLLTNRKTFKDIFLPIDKSLTPENFEQKIKTYLTFQ